MSDFMNDTDPADWCRLLSPEERAQMLDEIVHVSLSVGTRRFFDQIWQDLGVSTHTVAAQKSPMERLGVIEHLLSAFTQAIGQIERSPLMRLTSEQHFIAPPVRAKRISTGALLAASRRGPGLHSLEETRPTLSYDTLENRTILAFCSLLERDCTEIVQIARAEDEDEAAERAMRCAQRLRGLRQADWWQEVAVVRDAWMTAPTQRASQHPDYAAIFQAAAHYRWGLRFARDQPLLTLPQRETWRLYEAWCLIQTLEALRVLGYAVLGSDWPTIRKGRLAFTLAVGEHSRVTLRSGTGHMLSVTYNQTFAEGKQSLSHTMQPDVTITDGQRLWILDAKFKAYAAPGDEGADINQMHAYRDAITDQHGSQTVANAWCLYPGLVGATHRSHITYGRSTQTAVGALCLRPGDTAAFTHLRQILTDWLGVSPETEQPMSPQT